MEGGTPLDLHCSDTDHHHFDHLLSISGICPSLPNCCFITADNGPKGSRTPGSVSSRGSRDEGREVNSKIMEILIRQ